MYVTAEWTNPTSPSHPEASRNQTNEAVIWDSIITAPTADHLLNNVGPATLKKLRRAAAGRAVAPERGVLSLKNQKPKYQITHPTGRVAAVSDDVKLRVHYNVQPWVGLLTWDQTLRDYGLWKRIEGGLSKAFAFPAVKKKDDKKTGKA